MTVSEMHQAFRLQLDKSSSLVGNPDFLPEEIDYWLNEAQDRFIKQRLYGNNFKQEKFDNTQKRIDDLKSIVVVSGSIGLSSSSLGSNVKEGSLPISDATSPYLFYINSTTFDATSRVLQAGNIIKFDDISDYLKDLINDPYIRRPLVSFYGSKIVFVYGDEFVPTTCDITYVKRPKKLVSGTTGTYETNICELSIHTHPEIVIIAVDMVIENTESIRTQTFEQLNASKSE